MPTLVEVKQKNDLLKKTVFTEAAAPWRLYNATLCHFYSKGNIELIIAFLYQCRKWLIHFLLFIYGETTMQISRFNCVVLLTMGFICSSAMADSLSIGLYHVSPPTHIEALRDFNISSEVNALRQVKKKCDNAFRNSDGSDAAKAAAYKPYEDEKVKQFKNAWKRLRDQHAKSRVTVTLEVGFHSTLRHSIVRIDSPSPHLKPVKCGYRELCRCEPYELCNFDLHFERIENNGFTYVASSNPQWKPRGGDSYAKYEKHWAHYLLQANFAYTDAYLNALADRDLQVLKDRIMQAL